jgi:hypothetical protein
MKTDEQLIDQFKERLPNWSREQIAKDKLVRFAEAYLMIAGIKYRPAASGDVMGSILLSPAELRDQKRPYQEAVESALRFNREEDGRAFQIGCSDFRTCRAFVLSIEAARLLTSGGDGGLWAARLLKLAIKEIELAVA